VGVYFYNKWQDFKTKDSATEMELRVFNTLLRRRHITPC